MKRHTTEPHTVKEWVASVRRDAFRRVGSDVPTGGPLAKTASSARVSFDEGGTESVMLGAENTFKEIEESDVRTAIVPLGSVEGKGSHLPLGTDLLLAEAFAARYARRAGDVYLLPTLPFATSESVRHFPGTIYLDAETMWRILEDLVESLSRQAFERIVVLNFCSYNWVVKPVVRELNLRRRWARVVWVEPKRFAEERLAERFPNVTDHHAGLLETALMLHLHPEWVVGRGEDHQPDVGREMVDYVGLRAVAPQGVWGTPSLATPELGAELCERMLDDVSAYVVRAWEAWETESDEE